MEVVPSKEGHIPEYLAAPCPKNKRSRRWQVTINNFTYLEEETIRHLPEDKTIKYCLACEEHLDDPNQTPHIHCYFETYNAIKFETVKAMTSQRAHVELALGSRTQNVMYLYKENNILVEVDKEENKSNLANAKASLILNDIVNLPEDQFIEKHTAYWMKNFKKVDEIRTRFLSRKIKTFNGDLQKKNFWIWGPTGVGKSTLGRSGLDDDQICIKGIGKWHYGYDIARHKRILLDDYPRYDGAPGSTIYSYYIKTWADRYKIKGETKGGFVYIDPACQFVVTSNFCIDDCIPPGEDHDAVKRRFCEIHITDKSDIINYFELLKPE